MLAAVAPSKVVVLILQYHKEVGSAEVAAENPVCWSMPVTPYILAVSIDVSMKFFCSDVGVVKPE
jgi:hypothetical protein